MMRYRRYRAFLIVAVFALAALYHFTTSRNWEAPIRPSITGLNSEAGQENGSETKGEEAGETKAPQILKIEQTGLQPTVSTSSITSSTKASLTVETASGEAAVPSASSSSSGASQSRAGAVVTDSSVSSSTSTAAQSTSTLDLEEHKKGGAFGLSGQGRHEVPPPLSGAPIYWTQLPEHFPVPTESLISLPTGKPKPIPKIQFQFKDESSAEKMAREEKRIIIKEAFKHAWAGYREFAWMHDEVKPVSAGLRDPFCGWAATLVDTLDTLAIMGLDEEFRDATEALSQIEFTTTPRPDIPLFETTIRYLGGLLAAHDLTQGKYEVILNKAVELANVLMGAFDTPNRMPIMYYFWRPTFASNPHRAGTRAVLAELGSLSMEFTRLAQITGDDKYYDAIARITNELQLYQPQTKVPGLWPKYIDTSGCKKPETPMPQAGQESNQIPVLSKPGVGGTSSNELNGQSRRSRVEDWPERTLAEIGTKPIEADNRLQKRQLDMGATMDESHASELSSSQQNHVPADQVDCQPQGLTSPPNVVSEHFTFAGSADSTYEYLPKQFLLLGGQVPQYREMYEDAVDAANKHLLFRPMIPEEDREILVIGSADVKEDWKSDPDSFKLVPDQSHLLCFSGGMWGIGSKIFGREGDMEIAQKLTDGCVWAYEATATGIMPESMSMMPCDSRTNCKWNQTRWYSELDPYREQREDTQRRMKLNEERIAAEMALAASQPASPADELLDGTSKLDQTPKSVLEPESGSDEIPTTGPIAKRQLGASEQIGKSDSVPVPANAQPGKSEATSQGPPQPSPTINPYPTHEEYVESRIERERLPPGVPFLRSKDYILRPEAIESVFIMYRMTGDEKWREKGWKMFQAIQNVTLAEYGNSAIKDVTRVGWENNQKDQMESFWLAETLKYFYLLFSPPTHISLDDYVL